MLYILQIYRHIIFCLIHVHDDTATCTEVSLLELHVHIVIVIQVCTTSCIKICIHYLFTCISYCSTLQSLSCEHHLLSLPDELLLMVLSNLDQRDLFKCMLVCRRLFHIASDATLCKCLSIPKLVHTHAECHVRQLMIVCT